MKRLVDAQYENVREIQTVQVTVRDILKGSHALPEAHLVYTAGLLDYLLDEVATFLLARMWQSLAPGGTAFIANFVEGSAERGYMEAFMDWWLEYRSPASMRALAAAAQIPDDRVSVGMDPSGRVVELRLSR